MAKVKSEIENQCPLKIRQVEIFMDNYSCSSNSNLSEQEIEFK
jgi:hypothetical protein